MANTESALTGDRWERLQQAIASPQAYAKSPVREADVRRLQQMEAPKIERGLPEYIRPQDSVPRAGQLSAEAVVREYESAASEIESIGRDLVAKVKECQGQMDQLHEQTRLAIENLRETAKIYRDAGSSVFQHIENCTIKTQEVLTVCSDLRSKIK